MRNTHDYNRKTNKIIIYGIAAAFVLIVAVFACIRLFGKKSRDNAGGQPTVTPIAAALDDDLAALPDEEGYSDSNDDINENVNAAG